MAKFSKGQTIQPRHESGMPGYTITAEDVRTGKTHTNMIVVYNNKTLRDDILAMLGDTERNYRVGDYE